MVPGVQPMNIQLSLPPELEGRLRQESQRQGLPPDAVTVKLLDEHLPRPGDPSAFLALLKQLPEEDEAVPEDGSADFFQSLDADRPSFRKLFPPELKGISW